MVLTGYGTDLAVEAMKLGARDFVDKPIDLKVLLSKVTSIMQKRHPARNSLDRRLDRYLRDPLGLPALSLRHLPLSSAFRRATYAGSSATVWRPPSGPA